MKTKISNLIRKNAVALVAFIMMACSGVGLALTGCQQNEKEFTTLPYLAYTVKDPENMSDREKKMFFAVLDRIKFTQGKDGLLALAVTSGRQVNVAEEWFDFVKEGVDSSNAFKLRKLKEISLLPRTRMWPGEGDWVPTGSDCVACCVGYISRKIGHGPSYREANALISSAFKNGVPFGEVRGVLRALYGSDHVTQISLSTWDGSVPSNARVMLGLKYGHAVVFDGRASDGTYAYIDPQLDDKIIRYVSPGEVENAFQVNK